jgi:hypothetical protein
MIRALRSALRALFLAAAAAVSPRAPRPRDAEASRVLADILVGRLNDLIRTDPSGYAVKDALAWLIEARLPCLPDLLEHPTIQVDPDRNGIPSVGFLGMLNGIVGAIPEGSRAGSGYIAAVRDDVDHLALISFEVVDDLLDAIEPVDDALVEAVRANIGRL